MKFKKILSVLMVLSMILSTIGIPVFAEEADLTISSAEELKAFALSVNEGNNYEGKMVVLANNIDMEYTAVVIGTKANPFKGTFDGQGNTVSNLTIYENGSDSDYFADSDDCLGLFGVINSPAVIKNVTVHNPYIVGSAYIGGIVGMGYTGAIENCHVTGEIDIEGFYMVGGINGHGYAKISNCSVIGDEDWDYSYVGATYKEADLEGDNVGGIVGHNGENNDIIGCEVKNVTVSGTRKVGGIVGIAAQNSDVIDCVVSNITVETTATEEYAAANAKTMSIGGLVGQYQASGANDGTISGCEVSGLVFANENNVTVSAGTLTGGLRGTTNSTVAPAETVTATNNTVSDVSGATTSYLVPTPEYVAKIGDVEYETLADAIVSAANGDTVTLISDLTIESDLADAAKGYFNIAADDKITLDLGGNTINVTDNSNGNFIVFYNYGDLTIKNGTVKLEATVNRGWNAQSTIILNRGGNLTIESGTYTHNGGTDMAITVDDSGNSYGDAYMTVNGGEISSTYIAVRMRMADPSLNGNPGNGMVYMTVNGGTIKGTKRGIWGQITNASSDLLGGLSITGGTIEGDEDAAINMASDGYDNIEVAISDNAVIKGDIKGDTTDYAVTGGTFTTDVSAYCADGYKIAANEDGTFGIVSVVPEINYVAKIGDNYYDTLAEAIAAAATGDEIVLLADVTEDVIVPAGVIFNGNGKQVGTITAAGEITFKGHTKATSFGVQYTDTTINIGEGACLEITGTGRMVIGHGCTFNIEGNIADAKTANVAELTPSLIAPGASFTGAGVNFNVTNAYIKFTAYCSSKNSNASGTFNMNVTNSIWEQTGSLVFSEPTNEKDPTFNFNVKDSVLNSTSHLVFAVTKGEIIFDNSNVNVGNNRQLENRSNLTIKNGSVVYAAHATSSNAKNPGTTIVENATYIATGEFSGSDVGTGTLIVKNGANVTMGKITKANIVVDATDMVAGDIVGITADLSALSGTVSVVNNTLEAKIEDGKIVLVAPAVAKIGDTEYTSVQAAIDAAVDGDTVEIYAGEYSPINISNKNITIKGTVGDNGELLTIIKGGNPAITGHSFNGTIKDIKIVDAWKVMYAEPAGNVTVDNVYVTGATYGLHLIAYSPYLTWIIQNSYMDLRWANSFGVYGGDAAIIVKGNQFESTNPYYSDYGALHVNSFLPNVTVEENIFGENARIYIDASVTDTSNINISKNYHADGIENAFVDDADGVTVPIYEYYKEVDEDGNLTNLVKTVAKIGNVVYESLEDAIADALDGDTVTLLRDVELDAPLTIKKSITLDGNGYIITQSEECNNNIALVYFQGTHDAHLDVTVKNTVFDGLKVGAAIRTLHTDINIDGCTFENFEHTVGQGLVRLTCGDAEVENSEFLNNDCCMAISFNWDAEASQTLTDTIVVDNCEFTNNTASQTALIYYVKGTSCTIKNSEFTNNTVNCNQNGATIYLGFMENCVVTGNLFKNNNVIDSTGSVRVGGAIFFGYDADVSGNVFINNTASNANGDVLGQVCTSTYYECEIDLSGNYWGGEAPVYGKDYTVVHQTGAATFTLDNYNASYSVDDEGNVVVDDETEINNVAQVGKFSYTSLQAAIDAANTNDTVTLLSDIEMTEPVVISGKTLTLDLGEYTISDVSTKVYTSNDDVWGLIALEDGAKLTICGNGTIDCNYTNVTNGWTGMAYCIDVDATSELVVNGGNFINGNGGIQTQGKVTVNGGTFVSHNGGTCIMAVYENANVTINDGTFKDSVEETDIYTGSGAVWSGFGATVTINGGYYDFAADPEHNNIVWTLFPAQNAISGISGYNSNMTVTGGTFINFNPATDVVVDYSSSTGFTYGSVVADGFTVEENEDGTYGVIEDNSVAQIGDNKYETLEEALEAATENDTIKLLNDVTITETIKPNVNLTIDGNNKTITVNTTRGFDVVKEAEGVSLTIKNLTIANAEGNYLERGVNYNTYGTLTLENVTISDATYAVNLPGSSDNATVTITDSDISGLIALNLWGENADVTVTDSVLTSVDNAVVEDYAAISLNNDGSNSAEGTVVTVTGGKIIALNENGENSAAVLNATSTGRTEISDTTEVTGDIVELVAVIKYGDNHYGFYSLADAIAKANENETITIVKNISDVAVTVDKSLTITGNVTLNNVSITGSTGIDLTVSNLTFEGNSWIDSCGAASLTVSDVTANVTPSNTSATNSRSAFISLGKSEQSELELTVEDSEIVVSGGGDPILGWAAITEATIKGNTFGSEDAYQENSDSVKFMSIADDAVFTITGNTVYSNYNGFVFGQNTTRDNAYTAIIENNTFVGSADHVWIEVSGATTTHATIQASSTNTVNGEAFTANDIKASSGITTWTSYAGVDVVLDDNGKVIGGQLAFLSEDVIAEDYAAIEDLNGSYIVGEEPTATVNNLGAMTIAAGEYIVYGSGTNTDDMPLSFVMQFLADQDAEDMETSPYADWYGDFVLTFTGLENGSFTADGCYLAGYYGDFGWIKVPVDGLTIEEGVRYPVMLGVGMGQKYDYICESVKDFRCALYLTDEILAANSNLNVSLELSVVDSSMGEDAAAEALIDGETIYKVGETTYTAEDFKIDTVTEMFTIAGTSASLDSSLALNFYFNVVDELTENNYYAVVEHTKETGDVVTTTIPFDEWKESGEYKAICYTGIAAKEMADEISITIYDENGAEVSEAYKTSLREYVLATLNAKTTSKEWKTALIDMLNYGAAAQEMFGYNLDNLATAGAENFQEHASTEYSVDKEGCSLSEGIAGTTLYLEDIISLNVYFENNVVKEGMYAIYSYTTHAGTEIAETVAYDSFVSGYGFKGVSVGAAVADAPALITVELYKSDNTVAETAVYSVNAYLSDMIEKYPDESLYPALAKFAASAKTAFAK